MSNAILSAVIVLGVTGLVTAVFLFVISKRFAVKSDPRIARIQELLPGANCGGCGFPGCSAFAEACVRQGSLSGMNCSVSKPEAMAQIAAIMGSEVEAVVPRVAVVRCDGSCANRPRLNVYDGAMRCSIANMAGGGETGCFYGCLGCGDCVGACKFGAIHMDAATGLPVVDQESCVACGACVSACPRHIIELRNRNKKDRRVYVSCVNRDRGPVAKKACAVACIGCGKCVKACQFEAITFDSNLAYIDPEKCRLCRKCVDECPQHVIKAVNFPAPLPAKQASEAVLSTEPANA